MSVNRTQDGYIHSLSLANGDCHEADFFRRLHWILKVYLEKIKIE